MDARCETPRDCGECDGCKRKSDARESQLDAVQTIIEISIRKDEMAHRGIDDLDFRDFVMELGASITNALDDAGWLKMDES